jgi:hypothetical protein
MVCEDTDHGVKESCQSCKIVQGLMFDPLYLPDFIYGATTADFI